MGGRGIDSERMNIYHMESQDYVTFFSADSVYAPLAGATIIEIKMSSLLWID